MKLAAPISIEDFEKIAAVLGPCELVNGEIVFMAPGGIPHSTVSNNIAFLLTGWARQSRLGRVLSNEAGVVTSERQSTVRGADIAYISYKRLPAGKKYRGFLKQPPELIVEVLGDDDTWKKTEEKIEEYHALGVDAVWVVSPKTLSLRIYPRQGEPSVLHEDATITGGKLLPGFKCKVDEFFQE